MGSMRKNSSELYVGKGRVDGKTGKLVCGSGRDEQLDWYLGARGTGMVAGKKGKDLKWKANLHASWT